MSAIGSLHAGALSDRIGPRRALLISNAVSAVCLLGVATLANGFPALLLIMLVGSVGLMISGPATKVLVAREVPVAEQGLAFGIQMSAIPFAALLGGLAVPTIGLTVGWRWAFAGAVLIPLLGAVTLPHDRAAVAPSEPHPNRFAHVDFRPLVMLGVAAILGAAAATMTASFFVVTGTDAGFSEGVAGVMLSVVSGLVIVLRIAFGRVASRWESAHPYAVAGLFLVATGGYLLLALGTKALFPIGAFLALSFGWAWTGLLVYTVVLHHPAAPGLASSVIVGGMNLGSVLGPLVFGSGHRTADRLRRLRHHRRRHVARSRGIEARARTLVPRLSGRSAAIRTVAVERSRSDRAPAWIASARDRRNDLLTQKPCPATCKSTGVDRIVYKLSGEVTWPDGYFDESSQGSSFCGPCRRSSSSSRTSSRTLPRCRCRSGRPTSSATNAVRSSASNRPLIEQYGDFLEGLVTFDVGDSFWQERPAYDIVLERVPNTLRLVGAGISFALIIAIPFGLIAAQIREEVPRRVIPRLLAGDDQCTTVLGRLPADHRVRREPRVGADVGRRRVGKSSSFRRSRSACRAPAA